MDDRNGTLAGILGRVVANQAPQYPKPPQDTGAKVALAAEGMQLRADGKIVAKDGTVGP
jgi:hypothetical protein